MILNQSVYIMKKILFILLALPTMLMAQRKVAVYVTAPDSFEPEMLEIFSGELVNGIAQNKDFQPVDRTADFVRELQGSQDNQQICNLGQKLGVDLVCVANITPFRDSYYIKSRLVDVRTLALANSASEASPLATLEDILATCERLADRLFSRVERVEEEYSKIGACNKNNCDLISIDNTGDKTIVTFKLMDPKGTIKWSIYDATVIRDRATGNTYRLLSTNGINTDHSENYGLGIHEFSVTFEKVPYSVTNIDIIEPKGWEWTDIVLKNFGKVGLHQFHDDTQQHFARMMKEQEVMKRQEARIGRIINIEQSVRSYLIIVNNEQYSSFFVYLNGKKLGLVDKRSTVAFRVAPELYGELKFSQAEGFLLSPQIFKHNVPPMKPMDEISFNIYRP